MNILFLMPHVIEAFSRYGVSLNFYKTHKSFEHHYARLFTKHGHKATVAILSNSISNPLLEKHVFGHECTFIPIKGLKFIRHFNASTLLLSIINEKNFDLIHCFSYYSNFYDALSINAYLEGIPLVAQAQSIWKSPPKHIKIRKFFTLRFSKHLIPLNEEEAQTLTTIYKIPKEKITLIPNFIEIEDIIIRDKWRAREIIGLKDEIIILSVARLEYNKGLDILINAFSKICKMFNMQQLKLIIIGEGPEKNNLRKLVKELRIDNSVIFTGFQPNEKVHMYYNAADIFVLPSREESFGIVLLEAMAHGLPLIGADNGGIKDIIRHNVNGLLFKTGDIDSLASSLIRLIKEEEARIKMGGEGGKLVWSKYNSEKVYSTLYNIYKSVIE